MESPASDLNHFHGLETFMQEVLEEAVHSAEVATHMKLTSAIAHQCLTAPSSIRTVYEQEEAHRKIIEANNAASMSDAQGRIMYYLTVRGVVPPKLPVPTTIEQLESESLWTPAEINSTEKLTALPQQPYYRELCKVLRIWLRTRTFPITFPKMFGLMETADHTEKMQEMTGEMQLLSQKWTAAISDEAKREIAKSLFQLWGIRGILTMLRVRKTEGSLDLLPPSVANLICSFNRARGTLTEGARALSKHYHRSEENWWGHNNGTDAAKSWRAHLILLRLLREATWVNIHVLPHDVRIFEIRILQGYGARWSADGKTFRGFLEPQLEDGHETGWKH